MRKITMSAVIILSLISMKCDPDRNPNGTYYANLNGQINKISDSIILGDTLKLTLQWPDVLSTVTPLNDTRTDAVNSLQSAWFAYRVFGLDTINRTVYGRDTTKIKEFLTEGKEIFCNQCFSFTPYFSNDSKPYRCVLNIVPKIRGIFYLEIVPEGGGFKINNNFEGLFKVNFDVPDKHISIVSPFILGWEQAAEQRNRDGYGIYCFRVN